jgi:hypothetical protein
MPGAGSRIAAIPYSNVQIALSNVNECFCRDG